MKPSASASLPRFDPPPAARPTPPNLASTARAVNAGSKHHASAPWLEQYRFPKGVSANPGGRPKKKVLTKALEALLPRTIEESEDLPVCLRPFVGLTYAELFAAGLVLESASGNGVSAFREAADRTEGRVASPEEARPPAIQNVQLVITVQGPKTQLQPAPIDTSTADE